MKKHKKEILTLVTILLISGFTHGVNMFGYPYLENDEGTYMSQAWSLIKTGEMAPYTYWYDHAPLGWFLIAAWVKLTGGFFTFGASVFSGRVLMLVLHLLTSALLYYIAKKISGKNVAGVIAVLIFSLSPLGLYYQRRVLLDNIMIFWVFVSLALVVKTKLKLKVIFLSAATFGVAILTKENAIFFIPAFLYALNSRAHKAHKSFAILGWVSIVGIIVSIYFLYAILKGEFLPSSFLNEVSPRVSLIDTFIYQYSRGGSGLLLNLREWMSRDPITIIGGGISTLVGAILSIRIKQLRLPALLAILFWIFLARGKLIINFYIVPFIPLLSLNIGMLVNYLVKSIPVKFLNAGVVVLSLVLILSGINIYTKDETTNQLQSIEWIKQNANPDDFIAIDDSIYVDLHEPRFEGDKTFKNADWVWKIEKDPDVRITKLQDNWANIDYILLTHETLKQIKDYQFPFIKQAFDNSSRVADWKEGATSYIDIKNYLSTNGDWSSVYKLRDEKDIALFESWKEYKSLFIHSYGQVIDPIGKQTTSEGQAYAMLRAVSINDQESFNGVWSWTRDHLMHRQIDSLPSWQWIETGQESKLGDSATASDGDLDVALALLLAYHKWGHISYLYDSQNLISDIWKTEVIQINNRYYLTAGSSSKTNQGYLVNPSYYSPAHFHLFADLDPKHDWNKLADDGYDFLTHVSKPFPPNWVLLNPTTAQIYSAKSLMGDTADAYGYDAFRTYWRVALDALWFNSEQAKDYLRNADLNLISQTSDISVQTGALSVLYITNPSLAKSFYDYYIGSKFDKEKWVWGSTDNYFDQNWAWFGLSLVTGNFDNF